MFDRTKIVNFIKSGVLFLVVVSAVICSITKVEATERKKNASLYVNGQYLLRGVDRDGHPIDGNGNVVGEVSVVYGSMGGTLTYYLSSNVIRLSNFRIEGDGGYFIDMNDMGDVTVYADGVSSLKSLSPKSVGMIQPAIEATGNTELTLIGPGKLVMNRQLSCHSNMKIQDLDIDMYSEANAIVADKKLEIDNSMIIAKTWGETPNEEWCTIYSPEITVHNSILKLESIPAVMYGTDETFLKRGYASKAIVTDWYGEKSGLTLDDDMTVTDKDGNVLIERRFLNYGGEHFLGVFTLTGNWKQDKEGYGTYAENIMNLSQSVVIKSAKKETCIQVEKEIDKLGQMTVGTEEYERQLQKCQTAVGQLDDTQKQMLTNYSLLENALEANEEANKKIIEDVEQKISAIGTVTANSQAAINVANDAYQKLTDSQKKKVKNVSVLLAAIQTYDKIKSGSSEEPGGQKDPGQTEVVTNKLAKTKITYIKSKKKKQISLKWKKVSSCDGYQISYSTDKNFKKNKKTKTISKRSTYKYTLSKLKSKKRYYVRIRTYKVTNKKKAYSKWSSVKKITVK